jgi:hypothetical protein
VGQVGHLALQKQRADDVQLHAIHANHDYAGLGLRRSVILRAKADWQENYREQKQ